VEPHDQHHHHHDLNIKNRAKKAQRQQLVAGASAEQQTL